jgi:hypothetical protein
MRLGVVRSHSCAISTGLRSGGALPGMCAVGGRIQGKSFCGVTAKAFAKRERLASALPTSAWPTSAWPTSAWPSALAASSSTAFGLALERRGNRTELGGTGPALEFSLAQLRDASAGLSYAPR